MPEFQNRKKTQAFAGAACLLMWVGPCPVGAVGGENFRCAEESLAEVAEHARLRSAFFWCGKALPGDWSRPCPIAATPASHSGGGRTRFRIEGGEVFDWHMSVSGTHPAIQQDVIPHEVDHMVRASLTRRPIERWLDEGCASLMESPAVHERLRSTAMTADPDLVTRNWLNAERYPSVADEMEQLYAVGFSLVEFLLTRAPAETLLAFQQSSENMNGRLQRHYGMDADQLRQQWGSWIQTECPVRCAAGRCALHPISGSTVAASQSMSLPVLKIWSAGWCPACRQFQGDLLNAPGFRTQLEQQFELRLLDFDREPKVAATDGIQALPTFLVGQNRLTGYSTPADLLQRLASLQTPRPPTAAPPSKPGSVAAPSSAKQDGVPAPVAPQASQTGQQHPAGSLGTSLLSLIPVTLTVLQLAGVIGGSVATGGVGGLVIAGLTLFLKRRARRIGATSPVSKQTSNGREGSATALPTPFPRQLDEAGELLELAQSEGRVAALDTLRGMFLDDELEKLERTADTAAVTFVTTLRNAIDTRIETVAPLTTKIPADTG